jgi:CheY-like chemotaxis protein
VLATVRSCHSSGFQPHIVLLDIKLPDLDGYDVLTRLKPMAGLEKTLFIALTGYGPEEIEKNGHGVSFDLVLRKPRRYRLPRSRNFGQDLTNRFRVQRSKFNVFKF